MGQVYAFRFYSPQPMLTPERVVNLLHTVSAQGFSISSYLLNNRVHYLEKGQSLDLMQIVAADGTCAVNLTLFGPEGYTTFILQTFLPEVQGAQASVSVDKDDFDPEPKQMASHLLELAKAINLHLPIYFGWGDHELQLQQMEAHLRFDRIAALAWANLFSSEMVRRIGAEQLKSLPFHQIQWFKQGALCLLTPLPDQPLSAVQKDQIATRWPGCRLPLS